MVCTSELDVAIVSYYSLGVDNNTKLQSY